MSVLQRAMEDVMVPSDVAISKAAQEEYGKWLSSVFGQAPRVGLGTFTFRPPDTTLGRSRGSTVEWSSPGRQFVGGAARRLVSLLTASGTTFFVALEVGSHTRRLHLHALESSDPQESRIVHEWWRRRYGFESYRAVDSLKGVSLYVAKYVTKADLPFWAGGPLFRRWLDKREIVSSVRGAYVASSTG